MNRIAEEFFHRRLVSLQKSGDSDIYYRGYMNASVMEIIENGFQVKSDNKEHANHRIGLFDEHGEIIDVLSQSDIVSYIHKHAGCQGPLAHKTVQELGLSNIPVMIASHSTTAIEAFRQMAEDNISGMAIVDADGVLEANISISDLRGLTPVTFGCLAFPVMEFLTRKFTEEALAESFYTDQQQHAQDIHHQQCGSSTSSHQTAAGDVDQTHRVDYHKVPPPAVSDFPDIKRQRTAQPAETTMGGPRDNFTKTVRASQTLVTYTADTTLEMVIELLVNNKVHRIYEVDEKFKPVGVVTLTDILALLSKL
eukprot:gene9759-11563_t